jgi:hypothetical protein
VATSGWCINPMPTRLVPRIFLDLVSNTNTHAARTRTGTHERLGRTERSARACSLERIGNPERRADSLGPVGFRNGGERLRMGTVALPAQAASLDRVVNAQLANRPDSGEDGNFWALNHWPQIKITETAPGEYKVTVRDNGKFSDRDRLGRRWHSLRNCTPGYSPCLPPASDYDCRGGSGNGPKYTGPVRVTGSDPYHLDRNRDGKGCERS